MNDFTKTKIHFALALLGSIFALHPFLERFEDQGFVYLGYQVKLLYAYILFVGFLALCVYCYGLTLISERPHSWLEKMGNYSYALAVMVPPLFAGLYLSSLLADQIGQSHLAWAAPSVAVGLGLGWLVLSQLLAWLVRRRLGEQDRTAKIEQLAKQELVSLNQARELFLSEHYDLSVIEAWKALEARLRRVLFSRGIAAGQTSPDALIRVASRAGVIHGPTLRLLQQLKQPLSIAMSSEPLSREAANAALNAARQVLATISVDERTSRIESGPRDQPLRASA